MRCLSFKSQAAFAQEHNVQRVHACVNDTVTARRGLLREGTSALLCVAVTNLSSRRASCTACCCDRAPDRMRDGLLAYLCHDDSG